MASDTSRASGSPLSPEAPLPGFAGSPEARFRFDDCRELLDGTVFFTKDAGNKEADAAVAMLVDAGSGGVRRFELRRGCIVASRLRLARLCKATGKEPADAPETSVESGSDMVVCDAAASGTFCRSAPAAPGTVLGFILEICFFL